MKRCGTWYILWFWRTKGFSPPSLFDFITLITYQFYLLPFACLACLCAGLCSRTLVFSLHPLPYVEANLKFTTTHVRIPAVNYNELQDIIIGTKSSQPISNYQYYFLTLSYYLPINAFYPWIHKSWTRIGSLPKYTSFGIIFSHFASLFIWTRRQLTRNVHNQSILIYHWLMSITIDMSYV